MSLINQMLKDLEQRRSQDDNTQGLMSGAHKYSAAKKQGLPWFGVISISGLLLILVVGYLLWERYELKNNVTPVTAKAENKQQEVKTKSPFVKKESEKNVINQPSTNAPLVTQSSEPVFQRVKQVHQTQSSIKTSINSISPNPVIVSHKKQSITINGQGFSQNTRITVSWTGHEKVLARHQVTFENPNQLRMQIVVGNIAEDWTVQAFDPTNGQSSVFNFEVVDKPESTDSIAVKKSIRPLNPHQQSEVLYQEGYRLLAKGQSTAGEQRLLAALKQYPQHVKAREILAGLYVKTGRVIEATDLLQDGLAAVPEHVLFAKIYARLLLDQNKTQQAINVLEKHTPEVSTQPDYYALMAAAYQRDKQHARAVDKYRSVLKVSPAAGVWWIGMAISLEALGQQPEALQAYEQAKKTGQLAADLLRYTDNRLSALRDSGSSAQKTGSE